MSDILNLDELFGLHDPVLVRFQGREYELTRPEAFGPREALRLERLQSAYNVVARGIEGGHEAYAEKYEAALAEEKARLPTPDEHLEEWANRLDELLDRILSILCPALAELQLTFTAKAKVFAYYADKVGAIEKKVGQASL